MQITEFDRESYLSHWFPIAERVLPPGRVPRTILVPKPPECNLIELLDDNAPAFFFETFVPALKAAAEEIGYPVFLRTDSLSGKHGYPKPSCFVANEVELIQSVGQLTEATELAFWSQQGTETWAVRERLPITPLMYAFGGLPLVPERRVFVRGNQILNHPYWPLKAIADTARMGSYTRLPDAQLAERYAALIALAPGDTTRLNEWSANVVAELGGDWSVDWMLTTGGWVMIDMARAEVSYDPSMDTGTEPTIDYATLLEPKDTLTEATAAALKQLLDGFLHARWQYLKDHDRHAERKARGRVLSEAELEHIQEQALAKWWRMTGCTPETLTALKALVSRP